MPRLIDANALISYMDECSKESRFRVYYGYAKSFIDDAPTIDAVPVVRCRECKHAYINSFSAESGVALCRLLTKRVEGIQIVMQQDDFCSYGERKGE